MPQSKEKKAQYQRDFRKGLHKGTSLIGTSLIGTSSFLDGIEYVPASYVQGINNKYQSLPARPRLLTLSDGQVLDRLNQPLPIASGDMIHRMQYCNESYNFKPNKGVVPKIEGLVKGVDS